MDKRKYEIQVVHVLCREEQLAWAQTRDDGFVVGSIPLAGEDIREQSILAKANSVEVAETWQRKHYGLQP